MRLHPSMRRRRAVPAARIARERGFGVSAGFAVAIAGNGSPSVVIPRPVAHPWRSDGQARDSSKGFISVPLAPSCRHGTSLIHFQEDDQHVRSIKTPKQPQQSHRPLERISSRWLAYANSDSFSVLLADVHGNIETLIATTLQPVPVSVKDFEEIADAMEARSPRLHRVLRDGGPYNWPALTGLVADDTERLWIGLRSDTSLESWEWAVFSFDGTHLGSVRLPAGEHVRAVRGAGLLTTTEDALGVPKVRLYHMNDGDQS